MWKFLQRKCVELSLLIVSNRLHPRNFHQCPRVVVFTGPHQVGAQGIATARHLANQNIQVEVFLANFVKASFSMFAYFAFVIRLTFFVDE